MKLSGGGSGVVWYFDDIAVSAVTIAATTSTTVWSYPNIHGDTQAVTDNAGIKQGATYTYDPYGNPLVGVVDNQSSDYDNAWLGQHQRPLEHHAGLSPLIEMGARPYNPTLGRFYQTDPIEGGSCNNYDYTCGDPVGSIDLDGRKPCSTEAMYGYWLSSKFGKRWIETTYLVYYGYDLFDHIPRSGKRAIRSKCTNKDGPHYYRTFRTTWCDRNCDTAAVWGSALGGCSTGGVFGGSVGSIVPFVGTAVGAGVGCALGFVASSYANPNFPP